jgi:DNA-binding response OmpR family regulator
MKILIAEDDAVSRMILRRAVEILDHECLTAGDGMEAWDLYCEFPDVDVIISDWMMPEMDGLELCNKVRDAAESRDSYTFFVFLTALGDKEHALKGLQAGADDYLSKPLDRTELRARLIAAVRVISPHKELTQQGEALKRLNRELFWQARTDPLTHLGNRLRLREDLEILKARVDRYGHTYCVVLCASWTGSSYTTTSTATWPATRSSSEWRTSSWGPSGPETHPTASAARSSWSCCRSRPWRARRWPPRGCGLRWRRWEYHTKATCRRAPLPSAPAWRHSPPARTRPRRP